MSEVKIKFNPNLGYQKDAVQSVVRLFDGQQSCQSVFSIPKMNLQIQNLDAPTFDLSETVDAVGNRLELPLEQMLDNLRLIQIGNGVMQSTELPNKKDLNFTVEMETGTGKTYVYIRTILELNKKYGFTKFIIVVPSIAIKEGVKKSLDITREHFMKHFDNPSYEHFVYDSNKLTQVHSFASSDTIQIMIINIDSFRKSVDDPEKENKSNLIHRTNDKLPNDMRPIDFIAATNPIVIIDEPQSADSTDKSKKAIASLNPLCTIRYSATHKDLHHPVYKLDAFDAYEQKLVKEISVAGASVQNNFNDPYIKLESVSDNPREAKIEIDVQDNNGIVKRKSIKVKMGDNLGHKTKRALYNNYQIEDIFVDGSNSYINFTNNDTILKKGEAIGNIIDDDLKRSHIRKTIEEHLNKELKVNKLGIKVLSLFFVDKVSNYRQYDEEGNVEKGKFARMFEEEFKKAITKNPKYASLVKTDDIDSYVESIHDGYFSIDKKGSMVEGDESNEKNKDNAERGYDLIMKNKELLLSITDCPVRFIFSHSALKEGWDNPNIFQICALREIGNETDRRQRIGRGLRICVNQQGDRVHDTDINTLTVIASETFEDFCANLQKEFENDAGLVFGTVQRNSFAKILKQIENEIPEPVGQETSDKIYKFLEEKNYIDQKGKIQDTLKIDLKNDTLELPLEMEPIKKDIVEILKKLSKGIVIKDADKKSQKVKINTVILESPEFKELWEKIKFKTTFRLDFNNQKLIDLCTSKITDMPPIQNIKIFYHQGKAHITNTGIGQDAALDTKIYTVDSEYKDIPDILTYLQNETSLKRKTIAEILINSKRLDDFKKNPRLFIETVSAIIKEQKQNCIVKEIKYEKMGDADIYEQNLFIEEELTSRLLEVKHSPVDNILIDSDIEERFAKSLDASSSVKLFAKLPKGKLKINTPLGFYSPDWAIVLEQDNVDTLYFVVETKGTMKEQDRRGVENIKIKCGQGHFEAVNTGVQFRQEKTFDDFIASVIDNKL